MHVAVIGAGIVGVTTAYELAADGHRVTVFERRGSVAAENSFAQAGLVAPGGAFSGDGPGQRVGRPLHRHSASTLRRGIDAATAGWLGRSWRAGRVRTEAAHRVHLHRLAHFSRDRLHELTRTLSLDYERADGCLVLLRTARDLAAAQPGLAALDALGTRFETLDAAGCRAVEPGLSPETPLHAGIQLAAAEVGNGRQFAHLLRQEAERLGVRFRFDTTVQTVVAGPDPAIVSLHAPPVEAPAHGQADAGPRDAQDTQPMADGARTRPFDRIVVCAALGASALLRPHGLKLPLQAVHGYSITAPLRRHELYPDGGPRSAVVDGRHQVTIVRLGSRVRVAGGAEVGGSATQVDPAAIDSLFAVLHDWFPGAAHVEQAQRWKGARPTLPDGPPVLGPSGIDGLWLNLGHGDGGWALACGSARLLADGIAGRAPSIDVDGLGIERLRGR